jgi:hypothetical protein
MHWCSRPANISSRLSMTEISMSVIVQSTSESQTHSVCILRRRPLHQSGCDHGRHNRMVGDQPYVSFLLSLSAQQKRTIHQWTRHPHDGGQPKCLISHTVAPSLLTLEGGHHVIGSDKPNKCD